MRETARAHDRTAPAAPAAPAALDRALPRLAAALDQARVRPRLEALLGAHGALAIHVLKHTPGKRCVLAYVFDDGTRVVGKLYRKDRALRHAATLAALGQALQGCARTPRLLDCWDDLGLVLQEWVPGRPVPEYADLAGHEALVEQLAGALADFHAAPVHCGEPADLEAHIRRTCGAGLASIAAGEPAAAADLAALAAAIRARVEALPAAPALCHGDFGPRQVYAGRDVVHFVDLDGLCQGDPALDVAQFRVGLETHMGAAGCALGERFLVRYLERRGAAELPTLAPHEAFCELRRAVILVRRRDDGWQTAFRSKLERAHARLAAASR